MEESRFSVEEVAVNPEKVVFYLHHLKQNQLEEDLTGVIKHQTHHESNIAAT